jgi:serine/threonine-protein kinase
MLSLHDCRYRDAASRAEQALELAPTYADAHDYLGRLQCEAGKPQEGMRRLRLAVDLDPSLGFTWLELARVEQLLEGRARESALERSIEAGLAPDHPAILAWRVRAAAWERDHEKLRALVPQLEAKPYEMLVMLRGYVRAVLGDVAPSAVTAMVDGVLANAANPRFHSLSCQLTAEALALAGSPDHALGYLERAADGALIDIVWVDRCPALESLRADPRFEAARKKVFARAQSVWT